MHMGSLSGTDSLHPISLAIPSTVIGNISSATAPSVVIDVSDPLIGVKDTVVYIGFYEAYGVFHGSNSMPTYFMWSDDIPGYTMRAAASTSYGPMSPQDLTVTAPSNFSPTVKRTQAGSSSGATFSSSAVSVVGTYTPVVRVPQTIGSAYMDPYWKVASNSYKVLKVTIGSNNDAYSNVRIELDTDDVSKVKGSGSSGNYLLSGVFVPLCYVVDTTDYSQAMLDKLDDIIDALADINQNITDSTIDIVTLLNANFASILASIGTSTGARDNMLYYLNSIVTAISAIQAAIQHQSGNPNALSSAIQYIEYYLRNVLSDTNSIVAYLDTIAATLANIADALDAANDQMDDINQDQEGIHDYEQGIYDDTNNYIGSEVIQGFELIEGVATGQARVALDFNDFWNSLYPWNQIYTFAMMMTLSLTIIRYSSSKSRSKDTNKKKGGTEGG